MQQAFAAQRAQDWAVMQESNKVMLVVAGTFAALGFLTLLIMACFQWHLSKYLAEISAALPALGFDPGFAADAPALAGQSNPGRLGTIEQTPERTHELGQSPHPALKRREGTDMSIGNPLFHQPGALVRRRRFRAVSVAVIVGLICAAGLALLLYVVASRRLGFG